MGKLLTGAVLSGGQSHRMGHDKALIKIEGQTLLARCVEGLSQYTDEIFIVSNKKDRYDIPGVPCVADKYNGKGPLGGIHGALMHATHTYVFVMACDMPFWEPELIQKIIKDCDGYDATVLKVNGYYEPLFAVYAKSCLPSITENLEEGRLKVTGFFDSIRLNTIDLTGCMEEDLLRRVTFNLNTPEDLQVLKKMGLEAF